MPRPHLSRGGGCFTPAMHKSTRSRPAASARYCFSTRRPTPRARVDRRGSAIRTIGSRRAIAGIASRPPLLCHRGRGHVALLLSSDASIRCFDYSIHAEQSPDAVAAGVANQQPGALSKQQRVV